MKAKKTRRAVKFGAEIIPFVSRPTPDGNRVASAAEMRRAYANFPPECKSFLLELALDHAKKQPDPIFAAIELCRMLFASWVEARKHEPTTDAPEYAAWEKRNDEGHDAYYMALMRLIDTPPTTALGVAAMIEFCLDDKMLLFGSDEPKSNSRYSRTLFRTLAKAMPDIA